MGIYTAVYRNMEYVYTSPTSSSTLVISMGTRGISQAVMRDTSALRGITTARARSMSSILLPALDARKREYAAKGALSANTVHTRAAMPHARDSLPLAFSETGLIITPPLEVRDQRLD